MTAASLPPPGLDDVVAAETRLSRVDGERGTLLLAGHPVDRLAPRASFEETAHLLRADGALDPWRARVRAARRLPGGALPLLEAAAAHGCGPMAALRLGVGALAFGPEDDAALLGAMPVLLGTYARLRTGATPAPPPPRELGHAAALLWSLEGAAPDAARARALETYLNTVIDHGMNASTFTARVIASTGGGLVAAVQGALGALEGPLHGGAPGPALAALLALRAGGGDLAARTRAWADAEIDRGARIMGFGHRVYRVRDPRADVLLAAAGDLLDGSGLLEDARVYEAGVLEVLARRKPGRTLATNVEFATALLLHGVGLDAEWFPAVFAVARTAGWIAHVHEQRTTGRLLRPRARYVGPDYSDSAMRAENTI